MATDNTNDPGYTPSDPNNVPSYTAPNTSGADKITNLEAALVTPNRVADQVFRNTPVGPLTTAIGDSFYGLNHRQTPAPISINKDLYGLTFFTRPRLNLSAENIRAVRLLTPLLSREPASIQRIIRCLLDPELGKRSGDGKSPFVDPQQAFIPILTNHLISVSGFPDVVAPTYTSPEGMYKEQFSIIDGLTQDYTAYDMTANFRNLPGDPISMLFYVWITYAAKVFEGILVPYPDMIVNNEIDYNTRIYRVVLDKTKTRVQKIGATGASFPLNTPLGASFNYESDRPVNDSISKELTINFRSLGACYLDDILIYEFNQTVAMFNTTMGDASFKKNSKGVWTNPHYTKVPLDALQVFNNRGYPRINPYTYELEWWVSNEEYNYRLPQYQQLQAINKGS